MIQEMFELFRSREPIPYIILAVFAVGWIIVFERFVVLQLIYRLNFEKFNSTLRRMLSAGDLDRARLFCAASGSTGLPSITAKAIAAYETENFRVRMVVSEESLQFMPRIRRRISQLPNLAAVAVLLGALAAVNGVWQSFQMVDGLELGLKSFAFSRGLSQALTPIALGLGASVFLMIPYGVLDAMAGRLEGEIEHSLTVLLNLLAPEMQPVFAQPVGATQSGSGGQDSGHDGQHDEAHDANGARGGYQDVASAERSDPVPDEEEII
jgi:biopolymer transport protein ExbB/TolQ